MNGHEGTTRRPVQPSCCPCDARGISRRGFLAGLGGAALGGMALRGLAWSKLAAAEPAGIPARRPLVVKPILTYATYRPRSQRSWRPWGGIQTQQDADREMERIRGELEALEAAADFPVRFLPLASARGPADVAGAEDAASADVLLVYAAGGGGGTLEAIAKSGKDVIFFVRNRTEPHYLWYEIIHPRFLRRHTDGLAREGIGFGDVVVDAQEEILWRLRALGGLKNTRGTRIIAIGGPGGWACPKAPQLAREVWGLDIRTVSYPELGKLIEAARADREAVALARERAAAFLERDGIRLETEKGYVENAFLLDQVFRALMAKVGARAITINGCMGTIMPVARTTACLTLTLLNDDGHLAFCESDFVVIPAGILLASISGRPMFFHNPTYPHDGIITLAHCTAPTKMNGRDFEPARILTHFESDYGAAPKVEMRKGQEVTWINPDFAEKRWMGLKGEIVDHPFRPICRSQIDLRFEADTEELTENMRGFHWMLVYGDYLREVGYALKRTPVAWKRLA